MSPRTLVQMLRGIAPRPPRMQRRVAEDGQDEGLGKARQVHHTVLNVTMQYTLHDLTTLFAFKLA